MSALHRVKTSLHVHDSAVQAKHAQRRSRDMAVERTRNAFNEKEQKRQAATKDFVQGGLRLHSDTVIQRLMKLNKNLWFEVAHADKNRYGIYLLDPGSEGGKQFICGMPRGMCREYTVADKDAETGEPKNVIPGWRNVLARLVRSRLISEPRAVVMFGTPSVTSKRWQEQVL